MIATVEETSDVRQRFYNAAKQMYPSVAEPGTVWVLTEVLGWEWDKITKTSIDGFGRDGYRTLVVNEFGNRVFDHETHEAVKVTRKWTNEEKRKLKDWWWLLGL